MSGLPLHLPMNKQLPIQHIKIYLDFATIPSLNYFLHFAEHYQDIETIRLFGLARFQIPERIIELYPEGKIRYVPVSDEDMEDFIDAFLLLLKQTERKIVLNFHLNLYHSFTMLLPLLLVTRTFQHKIEQVFFHFYDDGSEGIKTLYTLAKEPQVLADKIAFYQAYFPQFISDTLGNIQPGETIYLDDLNITRYLFGRIYPSRYILLKTDYLDNCPSLSPLKQALGDCYQEMDLTRFQRLSLEQKALLFSILNLPLDIEEVVHSLNQHEAFVFIGTTCFLGDKQALGEAHEYFIQRYLDKNSPYYIGEGKTLFYKGHPHAVEINQRVEQRFSQLFILNPSIPLEVLCFLGFNPCAIGGFASTCYFFIPRDKIHQAIFVVAPPNVEGGHAHQAQYDLSRLMLEFGYLSEDKMIYYQHPEIY